VISSFKKRPKKDNESNYCSLPRKRSVNYREFAKKESDLSKIKARVATKFQGKKYNWRGENLRNVL
jgi:hypothetical protein